MTSADHPRDLVTVVIAAKNEAPTIGCVVRRCLPFATTVIVVDGHSIDDTADRARQAGAALVLQDRGRGKGDALRVGMRHVTTPVTVFVDADGSTSPRIFPRW